MKNKKLIIGIALLLAVVGAIFLFFIFKNKKTVVVFQSKEDLVQDDGLENKNQEEFESTKATSINNENSEAPLAKTKPEDVVIQPKKETIHDFKIINNSVSWGFESFSDRKIDTIIIHSSYNALGGDEYDFKKLLSEYKEYGVSPHYVIDRRGNVYRLVSEKNIAYHAGESKVPDGRTGVNNFSIGIEIMSTRTDGPSNAQYAALKNLITDIKTRYKIKYTLGHSQIAPGRKDDPWNFDWKKI